MHPWKRFSLYAKSVGPVPRRLRARAAAGSIFEPIDDMLITAKVKAAIVDEPTLQASAIDVETRNGDVHLSGFALDPPSIDLAGEIAARVKGVKSVSNDIRVK